MSDAGVNWSDVEVVSKTGVNWRDIEVLSKTGVNWTVGLPFIRTSPDHGTAHDIAGQGVANPSSMRAAIQLARQLVQNRANEKSLPQP